MIRSAGLTILGVMSLGGASAALADGLDASGAPPALSIAPATYGVFSGVPENWSDLPVQLRFQEAVGYNSNILGAASNSAASLGLGKPIGSLVSISNFTASTKAYWEGQQFFGDVSLGMYRYLSDATQNTLTNSFDIGDNWTYGSKCNGKLIASEMTAPSQPGFQIGFNERNVLTTLSLNETGTCLVSGDYGLILNSGATRATNSAPIDTLNDYESEFIAAGISYTVSQTNSLQLLATVTGTNYTGRQGLTAQQTSTSGLLNNITIDQINLTYTKNLSPNLALIGSAGVVGTHNGSFTLEPASGFEPLYSISATWTATPKLSLLASASKTVSPPTSLLANLQVTDSANLGFAYILTPKVSLAAGVQASYSTGGFSAVPTPSLTNPLLSPLTSSVHYYSANASINYAITPFFTANLSYTFSRSVQANLITPTDVVLLALTFSPH
jgi:hypothetical protein